MPIEFFAYSGLLNGITSFTLGIYVLIKNPRSKLTRFFSLFAFSVGYWAINYFIWLLSHNENSALFFIRNTMAGAIVIPPAFTCFVTYLVEFPQKKLINQINFLISGAFLFFSFSDIYIAGVERRFFFPFWPVPGILFHFMLVYFLANVVFSHILMFRAIRRFHGEKRTQIIYVFTGTVIGYIGGCTNYFLWYQIKIPPFLNFLVSVYIATVAYAIIRHRLMDIEVVIKRTIVFAGLASFVFGVFAFVTFILQNLLNRYISLSHLSVTSINVLLIVLGYEPIRNFLINVTDKYLFQKKFDYAKILKEASREMALVTSFNRLTRIMLMVLIRKARTKNVAVYVKANNRDCLQLEGCKGYGKIKRPDRELDLTNSLINYLKQKQLPVEKNDLIKELSIARDEGTKSYWNDMLNLMDQLKAEVIVPSFLSNENMSGTPDSLQIQGILVLGQKKSDEEYFEHDLNMLATLAQEHALTFEKIRLFETVLQERELKLEAEKRAKFVNYTHTLKHEAGNTLMGIGPAAINMKDDLTNKLTKIRLKIESHLSPLDLQLYDSVFALINKYAEKFQRIGSKLLMIVDTVVGALSGNELSKQLVYFRVPWETAKRNAKIDYQFRFEVEIETENFQIYGNPDLIERVFENLFTNSRDVLEGKESKLITLRAQRKNHEAKQSAWFEYHDSGPGVPPELFDRVFEKGFSTKPKPKNSLSVESGHGQGLYVCRWVIEELHGGKIWLELAPEGFSKFVFWLPYPKMTDEVHE